MSSVAPEAASRKPKKRAGYKYDWDKITDGKPKKFVKDKHFDCQIDSLKVLLYKEARKRNLPVPMIEVNESETEVIVQYEPNKRGRKRAGNKANSKTTKRRRDRVR